VPLVLVLWDGATGLFPRARVYSGITLVTTLPLTHVAEGYYQVNWTPVVAGKFVVVYTVYSDAGFTAPSSFYEKAQDLVKVNEFADSEEAGKVMQSFTFDVSTDTIVINMWLEKDNALVSSGVSNATLMVFDSAAGPISMPPTQALSVGQGVFRFVIPNPGLPLGEFATFSVGTIQHIGPPARTYKGICGVTFSRTA